MELELEVEVEVEQKIDDLSQSLQRCSKLRAFHRSTSYRGHLDLLGHLLLPNYMRDPVPLLYLHMTRSHNLNSDRSVGSYRPSVCNR